MLQISVLLIVFTIDLVLGTTDTSTLFPPLDESNSILSSLIGAFRNGFDVKKLFTAFQAPHCVRECIERSHGNVLERLLFGDARAFSVDASRRVCSELNSIGKCVTNNPFCDSEVFDVVLTALNQVCNGHNDALATLVPCIRKQAVEIYSRCEVDCRLGANLMKTASLNTDGGSTINFFTENGDKVMSLPDIHVLCNSSTCFLNCMRSNIIKRCPAVNSELIESIFESVMNRALGKLRFRGLNAMDSYSLLVTNVLPRQCAQLMMQPKDIILTTPSLPQQLDVPAVSNHQQQLVSSDANKGSAQSNVSVAITDEDGETLMKVTGSALKNDKWSSFFERPLQIGEKSVRIECGIYESVEDAITKYHDNKTFIRALIKELYDSSMGHSLNELFRGNDISDGYRNANSIKNENASKYIRSATHSSTAIGLFNLIPSIFTVLINLIILF